MKKNLVIAVCIFFALLSGLLAWRFYFFKSELRREMCGSIILHSTQVVSRIDEAVSSGNRKAVLYAGNELMQLSGLLDSAVAMKMGIRNPAGYGRVKYLSQLLLFGSDADGYESIGGTNNKMPFTDDELMILLRISELFQELALRFYDSDVTIDSYPSARVKNTSVEGINSALSHLQKDAEAFLKKNS